MEGGGGVGVDGHPDPEISGGRPVSKIFFRPFGPLFGPKNKEGRAGPSPRSATVICYNSQRFPITVNARTKKIIMINK